MLRMSKRAVLFLIVVMALSLAAHAKAAEPAKVLKISIATASNTGVYYIMGAGMSKVLNDHLKGSMTVTVEATQGGVANVRLLNSKKIDTAIIASDVVNDAVKGHGVFKTATPMSGLFSLHKSYQHFVVLKNSPLKSIKDFKGKRVVTGEAGSGNEMKNKNILAALGLTYDDIKPMRLSPSEGADALKDGQADVLLLALGLPATDVMSLSSTTDIRLIPMTDEEVKTVTTKLPYFNPISIPANTYKGITTDIKSVSLPAAFVCRQDLPGDVTYRITKTLLDNWSEMLSVHASAKDVTLKSAPVMNVPLHPGAAKYFKEIGLIK